VPHDVVEPKIESKKKLVMQLDRDVQVCGIYLFVFLSVLLALRFSSCFYFGGGVMLLFLFSLIGAHIYFFYAS
jgi:hypothetical protein